MVRGNETHAVGGEGVPEGLLATPAGATRGRIDAGDLMARAHQVQSALGETNERFVAFVRERPLVALGAALGVGYVLGRALRRVI